MPSWLGFFQFSIFLVLLWVNQGIFLPSGLPLVFATLFPYLFTRLFCYDLDVPIFCSKIVFLLSYSVVAISSHLYPLLAGRILFSWFGMSYLVSINESYLGIFSIFHLSPVPSDLSRIIIIIIIVSFSHQHELLVFHWSSRDSKSLQISGTFFSIVTDLNMEMVSFRPPISSSSSPLSKLLGTSPSASITIDIIVTLMLDNIFSCHYYHSLIRAFLISVSRWFFTGVWVTVSLLKSPGLISIFWPFSIMLSFGWSHPSANFQVLHSF